MTGQEVLHKLDQLEERLDVCEPAVLAEVVRDGEPDLSDVGTRIDAIDARVEAITSQVGAPAAR